MSYVRYVLNRVVSGIASIWVAITAIFTIIRLIPGDPISVIVGRLAAQGAMIGGQELIEEYKRLFGLEGNILVQYFAFLRETLKGNLGYSIMAFPTKVNELIARALPCSIGLLAFAAIFSWSIGTLLGALAGWKKSRILDALAVISLGLYCIPYWILAIVLIYIFAYTLAIFPVSGGYSITLTPSFTYEFIADVIWHSILPASSIIISSLGWWFLSMRSMISSIKNEEFILFDKAKGLSENRIMRHAFRNALLPQVTGLALSLGGIVGGALLTEIIFAYPGVGWLLYLAVVNLDYPLIQGIALILTISVCITVMILDLLLPILDPRIGAEVGE